jgi:hypothetical protein
MSDESSTSSAESAKEAAAEEEITDLTNRFVLLSCIDLFQPLCVFYYRRFSCACFSCYLLIPACWRQCRAYQHHIIELMI